MLSKRSYRDLNTGERERLAAMPLTCAELPEDEWTQSLDALCELLDYFGKTGGDPSHALKELAKLPMAQREVIVRHLDLVLTGSLRDNFWAETRQNAKRMRFADGRKDSVWAYFQPEPIPPRARRPAPSTTTLGDRARAAIGTLTGGLATAYVIMTIIQSGRPVPIVACLLAVATAYVAAHSALNWGYRRGRFAAKERLYSVRRSADLDPAPGFTRDVARSFDYYFVKYGPKGADADKERRKWMSETKRVRAALCDEIAVLYREERIGVGRVKWLIRYLTRGTYSHWTTGTLFPHRGRYRVSRSMKARCVVSTTAFLALTIYVVSAAVDIALIPSTAAVFIAVVGTWAAGAGWSRILNERRRIKESWQEHDEVLAARRVEYERWVRKLEATRPTETQMENWLTADKTMALDWALKHYRLAWRDVLAHAFLQTPGASCKRARDRFGPWRYSKYDLRIFLLTQEGVREIGTEIDFEHGVHKEQERNNFRFDAVSSVHVATTTDLSYTLELSLMNGEPRNIRVTDPAGDKTDAGKDAYALARMSLHAAGFAHTLHILEGIAAEGKKWIERDPYINAQAATGLDSDLQPPEFDES
ncbi:hypothetical protein ACIA5G_25240 [Amycolatopsis sp. NPDC051758]|uniref:hypothetical protein n=1 Tax=Amycolatopsis sp. NPDC051758 TaxID=3363935 RepID=UPI00379D4D89